MELSMKSTLSLLFCFMLSFSVDAQTVLNFVYEGVSDSRDKSTARTEIFKKATEELTFKQIKEIIGDAKAEKHRSIIENRILKQSGKYILFMKGDSYKRTASGSEMTVTLKFSLDNLKSMLLAQGLFYKLEGPPKVLPLVSFIDRVNSQNYSWWSQDKQSTGKFFLAQQAEFFHAELAKALTEKGFYGMSPIKRQFSNSIPEPYRTEQLQVSDYGFLGEVFKAPIILKGNFKIKSIPQRDGFYKVDLKLIAIQSMNGRVIGEVVRSYETDSGDVRMAVRQTLQKKRVSIVKDLSLQLYEAWKRGTFGANLFYFTLEGRIPFNKMLEIKREILLKVPEIKSLRERRIDKNSYTFEMDASSSPKELVNIIKNKTFKTFKFKVEDVQGDSLALEVIRF